MSLSRTGFAMWNCLVSKHNCKNMRCVEVKQAPEGSRRKMANWMG